ncbi:hypothetical protein [Bradyrhizobium sp. URHA0013]|jgi:hypothetical protein|uniref:hypothetical protein n=1 Tax=Bradyrhizobium sp. URHA0013 TaxID=1380352 RepID=UPI0004872E6E|nr:hypothetical protein [Bradyrhizobium sp. URHA0013]
MKSSALFPFILLIAAGCTVQAAEVSYQNDPTQPPVSHFRGTCEIDSDGTKFAARACYTTYYPGDQGFGNEYSPPVCMKKPLRKREKEVLAKIYSRAPDYLQAKLCRLTQLFVTQSKWWGPVGWGFWEGPDRPPGTGVYLAIASRELRSKKSIAELENETVNQLLGIRDAGGGRRAPVTRLQGVVADPVLTILSEVAHEMGHVLLADANADGEDAAHPRRRVSGPPRSACFEDAFLGTSWNADIFHKNMRRWADFGFQNNNVQKNPDSAFNVEGVRAAVRTRNFGVASDAIRNVYRNNEFVSLQAKVAPEEDLAEMYRYKVLVDASPRGPVLRLDGKSIDVQSWLKSDILAKKVQCLRDLGFLTAQP